MHVVSFDFRETPIKDVAEDVDGHTIYIGNGHSDLASVDIRMGKLLGSFLGKCSGSIRSKVRHPELPVIASCEAQVLPQQQDTEETLQTEEDETKAVKRKKASKEHNESKKLKTKKKSIRSTGESNNVV
ncbi:hypothetical protein K7X08_020557 [Anisodus acutangulus]|uniref:Uncharacterized protein n=1 Tax=Anisodus acutangulus TaxID=402998 RepID=A0A9Q1RF38_9SOLA|nr:hypothetical protein K7X08_020557 [Anisodus acutangulus]